jgi:hypothetical protein
MNRCGDERECVFRKNLKEINYLVPGFLQEFGDAPKRTMQSPPRFSAASADFGKTSTARLLAAPGSFSS